MPQGDRLGLTSRIRPGKGRKQVWRIDEARTFPLPVIVDHMSTDPETGAIEWHIEAIVDLIDDELVVTDMHVRAPRGMDLVRLQREFLWATPVNIVGRGVPNLLEKGIDPFDYELPMTGFPQAADLGQPVNERLSEEFLEDIAREYLGRGRGYAKAMAAERHVSPRTVVSWVEKARRRGILTFVPQGGYGGEIIPKSRRPKDAN
jgi:hypothetical protein